MKKIRVSNLSNQLTIVKMYKIYSSRPKRWSKELPIEYQPTNQPTQQWNIGTDTALMREQASAGWE